MKTWKRYMGIGLLVAGGILVGKLVREIPQSGQGTAWEGTARVEQARQVTARIEQAREKNSTAAERAEKELRQMFADMRARVPGFVEDINGLGTKCKVVGKGIMDAWPWQKKHSRIQRMVEEKWGQHLMKPEEMAVRIKTVLDEYGRALQAERNLLLVDVGNVLRHVKVQKADVGIDVRQEYEERFEEVFKPLVTKVMGVEVASQVGSEVAGVVVVNIVTYVATKAGVLAAGGLSGAATMGIGLVVGLIVDWIVSNYAEGKMRENIMAELEKLERTVMDGDGAGHAGMVAVMQGMADAASTAEAEAVKHTFAVR